jgi:hypothetical protein
MSNLPLDNTTIVIPVEGEEKVGEMYNSASTESLKESCISEVQCKKVESNMYRSNCCNNRSSVDRRILGFVAQCAVSFAVLGFCMKQISTSEKGNDLTIYYTLIGGIIGNFTPTFFSLKRSD